MRLVTAEDIEREEAAEVELATKHNKGVADRYQAEKKVPKPKCACGCGKAAYWPHDDTPIFHTRLCGYLVALKMFARKQR